MSRALVRTVLWAFRIGALVNRPRRSHDFWVIMRCFQSKNVFAHCLVVKAILWLGHLEVVLKGDNEPEPQAMIERAMRLLLVDWMFFPSLHNQQIKCLDVCAGMSQTRGSNETIPRTYFSVVEIHWRRLPCQDAPPKLFCGKLD